MKRYILKNFPIFLALIVTGLIFGYLIRNSGLYLDDNVLIFPVKLRSFFSHFIQYNWDNGLFRPIGLIYYYFLYSIYDFSPFSAHFFPFLIHLVTAFILFLILKKRLNPFLSLMAALLFILNPLATEQYAWLSATVGILANALFLIQLWIIDSSKNFRKTFSMVFLLSFFSVFIYESTFFLFFPLALLLTKKYLESKNKTWSIKAFLSIGGLLLIPNAVYFISKLTFPPHVLDSRSATLSPMAIVNNIVGLFYTLKSIFLSNNALANFWSLNFKDGFFLTVNNYILKILVVALIAFLISYSFLKEKAVLSKSPQNWFWWLFFLSSLIPLFIVKGFNFSFRALSLPIGIFFIASIDSVNAIWPGFLNKIVPRLVMIFVVIFFLLVDLGIINKYKNQEQVDQTLTKNIKIALRNKGFTDEHPAYLTITGMPHSMVYQKFLQAEHIVSCYNFYWCAQASLNMITGVVKDTGIKFTDGTFSSKSEMPYEKFVNQRPLVELEYTKIHD